MISTETVQITGTYYESENTNNLSSLIVHRLRAMGVDNVIASGISRRELLELIAEERPPLSEVALEQLPKLLGITKDRLIYLWEHSD